MYKICILTRNFDIGGTQTTLISFLEKLDYEKMDVTLLCFDRTGALLGKVPKQVKIREVAYKKGRYRACYAYHHPERPVYSFAIRALNKLWYARRYPCTEGKNANYRFLLSRVEKEKEAYDLLLDFYGYGSFPTAYGARMVSAKRRAFWVHAEEMKYFARAEEYFDAYDRIFGVSNAVSEAFARRWPEEAAKLRTFYNVMDPDYIERASAESVEDTWYEPGKFRMLSVGRLVPEKGFDLAVAAAKILKEQQRAFTWYLIGDGPERAGLEEAIRAARLEENVILLGRKENPYAYMKRCSLYVQPSRTEGYCTTMVEARILHVPILASDIPMSHEQIRDGENGFLVRLTPEKLAEKIGWLMDHPEKREQAAIALAAVDKSEFTSMKELYELLEELDA